MDHGDTSYGAADVVKVRLNRSDKCPISKNSNEAIEITLGKDNSNMHLNWRSYHSIFISIE